MTDTPCLISEVDFALGALLVSVPSLGRLRALCVYVQQPNTAGGWRLFCLCLSVETLSVVNSHIYI